jgi:NitT/TauT family transport system substrate-binding protein
MNKGWFARIGSLVAVTFGVCSFPAWGQQLTEVRIGTNNVISDGLFLIADKKGFFKEQGIQARFIVFDAGPKMIAPLGVGQLDVASGSVAAGMYNAVARGINIRLVADKGSTTAGLDYMPLLVKKSLIDSGKVKTYADLKGLRIAQASQGGSPGSKLNEALKKGGVNYKDANHVYMGYPQHYPALMNGSIDASITTEPTATQAVEAGVATRFLGTNPYPGQQVAVILYGGDFIKNKPDIARKFMIAYIKAVRVYNDAVEEGKFVGKDAEEIMKIMMAGTAIKDINLIRKSTPQASDPDGRLNVESLRKDWEFFKAQGFLEGDSSVEKAMDDSFVNAALKVLGPYKRSAK